MRHPQESNQERTSDQRLWLCPSSWIAWRGLSMPWWSVIWMSEVNLLPKKDKVQLFLQQYTSARVLGLSETWFNDRLPTEELAVSGFRTHGRVRGGREGCLLVYVSECMTSIRQQDLEDADLKTVDWNEDWNKLPKGVRDLDDPI